ncbi:MAG: aminoglycoside phosphotransferase family protein [Bacillota bacterium]
MLAIEILKSVEEYVDAASFKNALNLGAHEKFNVSYLAQGEYNLNYLLESQRGKKFVFRINTGSQMHLQNQIAYEYKALKLLQATGVTPRPFFLDDSLQTIPYGVLVMEYLPGEPLNYKTDLERAAAAFSRIHGIEFSEEETSFLVREPGPFTGIYNEACSLLEKYFSCPQRQAETAKILEKVIKQAENRKKQESYLLADPWLRVINTEVNSHNFIVNSLQGTCHLIDWEKPILGEPAQDLSHFVIATTTMWKRDYVLRNDEECYFINNYLKKLPDCPQKPTFVDRLEMFKYFNYLRAVSWCAMAWTEYTTPGRLLANQDTFKKIELYIEPAFLKSIFTCK